MISIIPILAEYVYVPEDPVHDFFVTIAMYVVAALVGLLMLMPYILIGCLTIWSVTALFRYLFGGH
jgi:hypothetical protein